MCVWWKQGGEQSARRVTPAAEASLARLLSIEGPEDNAGLVR
jgi:hypothetical protein